MIGRDAGGRFSATLTGSIPVAPCIRLGSRRLSPYTRGAAVHTVLSIPYCSCLSLIGVGASTPPPSPPRLSSWRLPPSGPPQIDALLLKVGRRPCLLVRGSRPWSSASHLLYLHHKKKARQPRDSKDHEVEYVVNFPAPRCRHISYHVSVACASTPTLSPCRTALTSSTQGGDDRRGR
ncbi:hypothetical protein GQ53DRAFT_179678 [Thozetella sp. PMI_491]|nr:hypothetical protein GQ53DRAFT_179678 [Thozetella sp. PMI_491]